MGAEENRPRRTPAQEDGVLLIVSGVGRERKAVGIRALTLPAPLMTSSADNAATTPGQQFGLVK